jgi:ABC-type transport system substrate-binding protein
MRTKWLLIALPLAILLLLLQSSFWVPTQASQDRANPRRAQAFLRADIGDAKSLNPVISHDAGARDIFERNVFEGLMQEDENRKMVPRLAQSYETTEEAYLAVLSDRALPAGGKVTGQALLAAIDAAWKQSVNGPLASIRQLELVPAEKRKLTAVALIKNAKGREEPNDVELSVDVPERIRLTLAKVEPQLFRALESVVGASYFASYPFEARFHATKPELLPLVRDQLAELLPIGEHNPIITFHLRPGMRWHDGVPLTAEDVKFTYQAIVDPKNSSPLSGSFDTVKQVDVVDELTARVVYKRLHAQGILGWSNNLLVPKHLLDDNALAREADQRKLSPDERKKLSLRTTSFNRALIGSGPFRFAEWLPDQYIHITRNDDYWGQKSGYRDVFFRVIPDYLTMELEFKAGSLDMYRALPHQVDRYRRDPAFQLLPDNEGALVYIGYNHRLPMFEDARVRRALGMAIDVDGIIKHLLSGEGKRATGPYYSITPYFDPTTKPLPYDPAAALDLLQQAGWRKNARGKLEKDGKPFAFTLVTNNGNPHRRAIMLIAQEAWKKLGIDIKVQAFEWTVFLEDFVYTHKFDAYVLGWGKGAVDPDKYETYHSSQTSPYQPNYVGYQSPEADRLLEAIREAYDDRELIELTHQFHNVAARDQPVTYLYEPIRTVVIDKRVFSLEPRADGSRVQRKLETPPGGNLFLDFGQWHRASSGAQVEAD